MCWKWHYRIGNEIEVPGVEDRAIFLLCFSIEEILSVEVCTHSLITEHMFG